MLGLVLTAGGARGAYQAGVLKRIGELPGVRDRPLPFPIVTGASAGAINGAMIAARSASFREATQELREAEARGNRMLEQSRHQATELTNAARAEVEQTLEWARAQAAAILQRAQTGAEQLLAAAGLGEDEIARVAASIVAAAQAVAEGSRGGAPPHRSTATAAATSERATPELGSARPADDVPAAAPQAEDAPPTPAPGGPEPPVSPPSITEGAAETSTGEHDSPDQHAP